MPSLVEVPLKRLRIPDYVRSLLSEALWCSPRRILVCCASLTTACGFGCPLAPLFAEVQCTLARWFTDVPSKRFCVPASIGCPHAPWFVRLPFERLCMCDYAVCCRMATGAVVRRRADYHLHSPTLECRWHITQSVRFPCSLSPRVAASSVLLLFIPGVARQCCHPSFEPVGGALALSLPPIPLSCAFGCHYPKVGGWQRLPGEPYG